MKIGVVGIGTMGSGITVLMLYYGFDVWAYNHKDDGIILSRVDAEIERWHRRNDIMDEEIKKMKKHLHPLTDLESLQDVDIVIESIKENRELKKQYFETLDKICRQSTIFASNTSNYDLMDIMGNISPKRRKKFIGLHFFNPVWKMKLVEIGKLDYTKDEVIELAKSLLSSVKKEYIVVKNSPGYIVNMIIDPLINNAIKLLEKNIATAQDIDNAMKLGANHPMGPLALADLIGLDVLKCNLEVLYKYYQNEQFMPAKLLGKMINKGRLGRKSGEGFFKYNKGGPI